MKLLFDHNLSPRLVTHLGDIYLNSNHFLAKLYISKLLFIMVLSIQIDYPDNLPDALQKSRQQFEEEAKWAMAVKLFEMKRLSSGMAADLIGVDRVSFLLKLKDYGVSMIDLSEEELLSDLENA